MQWSHVLESITHSGKDNTVTANFANGKSYTGTILVGCDGPRSVVRGHLFDEPSKAQATVMDGATNISMAVSYPAETARYIRKNTHPVFCMAISPQIFPFMTMQDVPDTDKPDTWKFFIMLSWLGDPDSDLDHEGRMKLIRDKAQTLAEVSEPDI